MFSEIENTWVKAQIKMMIMQLEFLKADCKDESLQNGSAEQYNIIMFQILAYSVFWIETYY